MLNQGDDISDLLLAFMFDPSLADPLQCEWHQVGLTWARRYVTGADATISSGLLLLYRFAWLDAQAVFRPATLEEAKIMGNRLAFWEWGAHKDYVEHPPKRASWATTVDKHLRLMGPTWMELVEENVRR